MQKILKHFVIFSLMLTFNAKAMPNNTETAPTTRLVIKSHPFTVDGKTVAAFIIEQPDGTWGFHGVKDIIMFLTDCHMLYDQESGMMTVIHYSGFKKLSQSTISGE